MRIRDLSGPWLFALLIPFVVLGIVTLVMWPTLQDQFPLVYQAWKSQKLSQDISIQVWATIILIPILNMMAVIVIYIFGREYLSRLDERIGIKLPIFIVSALAWIAISVSYNFQLGGSQLQAIGAGILGIMILLAIFENWLAG